MAEQVWIGGVNNTYIKEDYINEEIICIDSMDSRYPAALRNLGKQAPQKLYCIGDLSLFNMRCVSVVGARKVSRYGRWAAYQTGKLLAEYGLVTVSGMAAGCDAEAHRGALDSEGMTIAVLGCGVDICYPASNREIRQRLASKGLIISEFPPGTKPFPGNFPRRNRIISGLSELTVVAEASLSSGSLITAGLAADQGREVMAFPANINSAAGLGCNKLIQDGVTPVVVMDDIISALGIPLRKEMEGLVENLGSDERRVFDVICHNGEITSDYIAMETGMDISVVNGVVAILEIKGLAATSMGKIYIAK